MLQALPLVFVLVGLMLYTVLGGADFGAGFWQLFAGSDGRAERIREDAHHAIGPVWEANHVWLIFVLTVFWTTYPTAFGSIASTLAIPLFIAAIGIIFRGAAYALRPGAVTARESGRIDTVFAVSSILTPFALGAAVGAIATNRVPVGNAAGNMWTSWLNPAAISIGVLAVATSAYLAAVYLAADSARDGDRELEQAFRVRALGAGVAAGAAAAVALVLVEVDNNRLARLPAERPRAASGDRVGAGRRRDPRARLPPALRAGSVRRRARRRGSRRRLGARPVADHPSRADGRPGRSRPRHARRRGRRRPRGRPDRLPRARVSLPAGAHRAIRRRGGVHVDGPQRFAAVPSRAASAGPARRPPVWSSASAF